jgi:hypothetical protein
VEVTVPNAALRWLLGLAVLACSPLVCAQGASSEAGLEGRSVIILDRERTGLVDQGYQFEPPLSLAQAPFGLRRGPARFRVFGFSEREALAQSGDPDGDVFSRLHTQGDMANRWSHAAVVKTAAGLLQQAGFGPWVSSLLGASILLPKEFAIDRRPSRSDLVIADLPLFSAGRPERAHSAAFLSIFGDGAVFLALEARF